MYFVKSRWIDMYVCIFMQMLHKKGICPIVIFVQILGRVFKGWYRDICWHFREYSLTLIISWVSTFNTHFGIQFPLSILVILWRHLMYSRWGYDSLRHILNVNQSDKEEICGFIVTQFLFNWESNPNLLKDTITTIF